MNKPLTLEEVKEILKDIKEQDTSSAKEESEEGGEYVPLDFDEV